MLEAVEEQCADKSLHGDHLHWLPGKPSAQEHGPHDAWGWEGYQRAHCHGVTEESRKEDAKRVLAREQLNARLAELQKEADVLQHRDAHPVATAVPVIPEPCACDSPSECTSHAPKIIADLDSRLVWALRKLGAEFGPRGVQEAVQLLFDVPGGWDA